jgi:class 3 adenylate cyclase
MSELALALRRGGRGRLLALMAVAALAPAVLLALLRGVPSVDVRWEDHPAHFWLVTGVAAVATALGYGIHGNALRRRDARLLLVSLAFVASAGFLALHALATPGVLVGKNAGFELATPVGLMLGGLFVGASALELGDAGSARIVRAGRAGLLALLALMAAWAVVSLSSLPPLDAGLQGEQLDGWQTVLGAVGVVGYGAAALGYGRLYRRRGARFAFAVAVAFGLLAEAMAVIVFAANWRVSWWEWHVLMVASFALIAVAARQEWHEERFGALYLDRTLSGVREASVLFADLQGFTGFSERAGAVAVAEMLNAYFGRLVPLMEAAGGEVHQLIGDAIMVVFNKDGDQPDHALRAARAALELQREAADVAEGRPEWPRFRAGVNSGEVVAGLLGGATGHRTHGLVGDTVNLASRLESQAPVGGVLVGAGTYAQLPPGTLAERLPPLRVKGKDEPVEAFVLHRVGPA